LEDATQVLPLDPTARIGHRDPDRLRQLLDADRDRSRIGVLDRVVEEIADRELDPLSIDSSSNSGAGGELETKPPPLGQVFETPRQVANDPGDIPIFEIERRVGTIQIGELEQILDERFQALCLRADRLDETVAIGLVLEASLKECLRVP